MEISDRVRRLEMTLNEHLATCAERNKRTEQALQHLHEDLGQLSIGIHEVNNTSASDRLEVAKRLGSIDTQLATATGKAYGMWLFLVLGVSFVGLLLQAVAIFGVAK